MPGSLYKYLDTSENKIALSVNGSSIDVNIEKGYVDIRREWKAGDAIRLNLPMPIRRVIAHPKAVADKGLVAIERGPVVYCAEFKDNSVDVSQLKLPDNAKLDATFEEDFFGGTVTLASDSGLKLIPYYLYANRGLALDLAVRSRSADHYLYKSASVTLEDSGDALRVKGDIPNCDT